MSSNLQFVVEERVFIKVYLVTLLHQSPLKLGVVPLVLGITTWLLGVVVAVRH